MKRRLLIAVLVAVALGSGCRDQRSKADKLAESEQQIVNKIGKLQERQKQITNKLAELDSRLAQVREQRAQMRDRYTEPTPTPKS